MRQIGHRYLFRTRLSGGFPIVFPWSIFARRSFFRHARHENRLIGNRQAASSDLNRLSAISNLLSKLTDYRLQIAVGRFRSLIADPSGFALRTCYRLQIRLLIADSRLQIYFAQWQVAPLGWYGCILAYLFRNSKYSESII